MDKSLVSATTLQGLECQLRYPAMMVLSLW